MRNLGLLGWLEYGEAIPDILKTLEGCKGKNQIRTPVRALDHAVAFLVLHGCQLTSKVGGRTIGPEASVLHTHAGSVSSL